MINGIYGKSIINYQPVRSNTKQNAKTSYHTNTLDTYNSSGISFTKIPDKEAERLMNNLLGKNEKTAMRSLFKLIQEAPEKIDYVRAIEESKFDIVKNTAARILVAKVNNNHFGVEKLKEFIMRIDRNEASIIFNKLYDNSPESINLLETAKGAKSKYVRFSAVYKFTNIEKKELKPEEITALNEITKDNDLGTAITALSELEKFAPKEIDYSSIFVQANDNLMPEVMKCYLSNSKGLETKLSPEVVTKLENIIEADKERIYRKTELASRILENDQRLKQA